MSDKDDGGPAFPTVDANRGDEVGTPGMTLRDYFAAKAMQGLLSDTEFDVGATSTAQIAFAIADAMIAESKK